MKTPNVKQYYEKTVVGAMMERFPYKNRMQVPRLEKIVLNMGLGKAILEPKIMDAAVKDMATIAGQRPVITRAKKAIANFKLRKGLPIGCTVTLRKRRMYEFLERLKDVALPRVRDFRGINPRSFDGAGNYTLAVREHVIFPEIDLDKVEYPLGMNVTITTNAKTDEEALQLLTLLGMPFRAITPPSDTTKKG